MIERLLPRVAQKLESWRKDANIPYEFSAEVGPADGMFRGLRRLTLKAGPLPVPAITYGLMGDMLVITTSERALSSCLAVAAGEEDGLWDHPLLAEAMGRDDLTALSLTPVSRQLTESRAGMAGLEGLLRGLASSAAQGNPEVEAGLAKLSDLFARLDTIAESLDFVDQTVTAETASSDGHTRIETSRHALTVVASQPQPTPLAKGSR